MKKFVLKICGPAIPHQQRFWGMWQKRLNRESRPQKTANYPFLLVSIMVLFTRLGLPCAAAKTLAITPIEDKPPIEIEALCAHEIYLQMVKSQKYHVLPDWFVQQRLTGGDWQKNWAQAFTVLPQADEIIMLQINAHSGDLMAILLERGTPPQVIKTEVMAFKQREPLLTCTELSYLLLGEYQEQRFRNPGLSAALSFIVPGAGHFYQGTPESVALGSGFLLAYLLVGGLGFSNLTESHVSRAQWGGILLLLTLTDIITAYFMASQEP